jgi:hypothetical protein
LNNAARFPADELVELAAEVFLVGGVLNFAEQLYILIGQGLAHFKA